jgi:hypothetical protein
MPQIGMGVLLHAGIISFEHFKIYGGRIINALQCFKNLNLVVRFFWDQNPLLIETCRNSLD